MKRWLKAQRISSAEIEIQFLSTCKISPRGSVHSVEALDEVREAVSIFGQQGHYLSVNKTFG